MATSSDDVNVQSMYIKNQDVKKIKKSVKNIVWP